MLLKQLTEASGVSGNENEVRSLIIDEIKDYVDELMVDSLGNIIAHKKGNKSFKKLMIAAHMDEVGLLVKDIDASGLLKFMPVGGIDKRILVSKTVKVGRDKIKGVIGAKPIHLQEKGESKKPIDLDGMYIDIGAKSKEDAEKSVSIGDYVVFDSSYQEFGDGLIKAKALDDRVGCALLIELIKEDKENDFYAVFTVMEELGLRGAGPAAYSVEPDTAIILEGTVCYELPELESHLTPTKLGEGPSISLMDRTTVYDSNLIEKIVALAEENNISYQYRKTSMGGNDSGKIHTSKSGCRTAALSVPCRYIHGPNSVMSKKDYSHTYQLLKVVVSNFNEGVL